jgi:ribosomal protein S12 methylthiotransferase accessory factor
VDRPTAEVTSPRPVLSAFKNSTSLRIRPIAETLALAEQIGRRLGISRVTDITRLDRVGIPVYVSVRPQALNGSLCVNAGKGFTADEARVGAWMEAIEYAMAEPERAGVPRIQATARDVLDGRTRPDAILDFCPLAGRGIRLEAPLECVAAEDICDRSLALVPAERVFIPGGVPPEQRYFGSSTCGLASGNSLLEATVHGLAEVIEHDICSFQLVRNRSYSVRLDSLPEIPSCLVELLRAAGLKVEVFYAVNGFGLPYFECVIADPDGDRDRFYNGGYGCHPIREIAVTRALTEAAQSRLSFIHGGRDDLTDWESYFAERAGTVRQARQCPECRFEDIPTLDAGSADLQNCFDALIAALNGAGIRTVLRVALTRPDEPLQVVKILVPGLEEFDSFTPRVGKRLAAHAAFD